MCLAYPMRVTSIHKKEQKATAEAEGIKRDIGIELVPDIKVGDYVMVHAGFAIDTVNEKEAKETIALFKEYHDALRESFKE